jgi:hypothetical protein
MAQLKSIVIAALLPFLVTGVVCAQFSVPISTVSYSLDNPSYAGKVGTPYLPITFQKAPCTKSSNVTDTLMVRLDTYAGYLEILDEGRKKVRTSQDGYLKYVVNLPDDGFITFRSNIKATDQQNTDSWYWVLYDGKTKLLKYTESKINECYEYGGIYTKCFKATERFYVQQADGSLLRIDTNKELIWAVFGVSQNQVKTYAIQNKLRLKRWADVSKLLQYFDSL